MAQYHGDIMEKVGNVYTREDDRNYIVAILLLWFFGFTGIHRFYLNDHTIGWFYLSGLAVTVFLSFAMLDVTLFLFYLGIASLALLAEFFYFIHRIFNR